MPLSWIVVRTNPQQEAVAVSHIRRAQSPSLVDIEFPQLWDRRTKRRKPLFATYIFVCVRNLECAFVRFQVGVHSIITCGEYIPTIPFKFIRDLRKLKNKFGTVVLPSQEEFKRGDRVRIKHGPLIGQIGLFEERTAKERCVVLMSLLGQQAPVKVEHKLLEAA